MSFFFFSPSFSANTAINLLNNLLCNAGFTIFLLPIVHCSDARAWPNILTRNERFLEILQIYLGHTGVHVRWDSNIWVWYMRASEHLQKDSRAETHKYVFLSLLFTSQTIILLCGTTSGQVPHLIFCSLASLYTCSLPFSPPLSPSRCVHPVFQLTGDQGTELIALQEVEQQFPVICFSI